MKIAVACSGLGHVRRGVEAWAEDLGTALRNRGLDVALFGGAESVGWMTVLPCVRRTSPRAQRIARFFSRLGGWRYGAGSTYEIEQTTFAFHLWRRIRRGYAILHVQDPLIGMLLNWLNRMHLSDARVILADGTGASVTILRRFQAVQHLTPVAGSQWRAHSPTRQLVFTIPNFVDVTNFRGGDKRAARARFNLPQDALIILCCAAIRKFHKRIDYLIEEFAAHRGTHGPHAILVIAGAQEEDTDSLIELAQSRAGDRVHFLVDLPRADMPELYRAADVFTLTSLFETFGIVLIEAMATGLPIICHDTPSFRYIAGPAGLFADMTSAGALAAAFARMTQPDDREALAQAARPHAVANFSAAAVIGPIVEMYRRVKALDCHG